MIWSEKEIASFLNFAPNAKQEDASRFLDNADNLEDAVAKYYDSPEMYSKNPNHAPKTINDGGNGKAQTYAPPPYAPPANAPHRPHTNVIIEAGRVRARDEQDMQNLLQTVQYNHRIYNPDIDPEHDTDYWCSCDIHQYQIRKMNRLGVQKMWSKATMYPGEKAYHDCYQVNPFSMNPYRLRTVSAYGLNASSIYYIPSPSPTWYSKRVKQIISLNNSLNKAAQEAVDAKEPKTDIWAKDRLEQAMTDLELRDGTKEYSDKPSVSNSKLSDLQNSLSESSNVAAAESSKSSMFSSLRKTLRIRNAGERAERRSELLSSQHRELRDSILEEEQGRWPDVQWRQIVTAYQEHTSMAGKIAYLRAHQPIQYLHLLRAGYFEPIPVAWADQASNPLKFSIDSPAGWRGITPAWRGYEDTAEERLYWVLNHREGSTGARLKPDFISALEMAQSRMASAVDPPPIYSDPLDTCHVQHTSEGYSKQVMPPPFVAYDSRKAPTDDTMILLDTSGSMDFKPMRPIYNQYLITGYTGSTQPKNNDVAKAIIRRFTDAMSNYDHNFQGYPLTTFANHASYHGTINHQNLDSKWRSIHFGGGTRVMTGWQKVKQLHFEKHFESATHHPVYGWQAGPETPMLRLLLLLDGEATDMDEFELDLLSNSWVHVTVFLIGVDGCPHHHRHANELQRISDVNHHVSFVDAQGNMPERFVTHELLKRHLGYEMTMPEFEELEHPPPYSAEA